MLTTILLLRANTDREKRAIILQHTCPKESRGWEMRSNYGIYILSN